MTVCVIQAAATCYIELIVKESDNNVKLIVLDRLIALKEVPAHEKVLQVITVLPITGDMTGITGYQISLVI